MPCCTAPTSKPLCGLSVILEHRSPRVHWCQEFLLPGVCRSFHKPSYWHIRLETPYTISPHSAETHNIFGINCRKVATNFACQHISCIRTPNYSADFVFGPLFQLISHCQLNRTIISDGWQENRRALLPAMINKSLRHIHNKCRN